MADPVIRLDKSKQHSTCHGDRTPEDPLYHVAFWQGGWMVGAKGKKIIVQLPFDVHGELVLDDGRTGPLKGMGPEGKEIIYQPLYSADMRAYLAAKTKRIAAIAGAVAPSGPQIDDDDDAQSDELAAAPPNADDVDLSAWLRGQAKYPPRLLREAALKRFNTHYSNTGDIVVDAVMEHRLVREDEVCPELAGYIKKAFVSDPSIHQVAANAPVGTGSRDPAFNAQMSNAQSA